MAQRKYSLAELLSEEELAEFYGTAQKPVAPPQKEVGGFVDAIQNYGGSWAEGVGTGIEDYFGKGPVSGGLQQWGREVQQENPLSGELFSATGLKELVGGMLPTVTGALGGAAAGTAVGGPVGGVLGGIAGGMAGYQPVAYKNISDYQKEQGYTNPDAKLVGSLASAGLEAAFGPERRIIGAMLTSAAKKLPKETLDGLITQAFKNAPRKEGEGWLKYVLKDLNRIGIVEGTTEVAQSATERAFGGAPMANQDAMRDYTYSAAGGYIGGGLFGGAMAPFRSIPEDPAKIRAQEEAAKLADEANKAAAITEKQKTDAEKAKADEQAKVNAERASAQQLRDNMLATSKRNQELINNMLQTLGVNPKETEYGALPDTPAPRDPIQNVMPENIEPGFIPKIRAMPDNSGIEAISSRDPITNAIIQGTVAEPAAQQDAFGISAPEVTQRIDALIEEAKRPRFGTVGLPATEAKAVRENLLVRYYKNPTEFLQRLNAFEAQKAQKAQEEVPPQPAVAPGQRALFRDDGTPTAAAMQPTEEERDFRSFQEEQAYLRRAQTTAIADALNRARTPAPVAPVAQVSEVASPSPPLTQMPTRQGNLFTKPGKQPKFKEQPYGMQEEGQAPAAEKDVNTPEMFGPKGGVTAAALAATKAGKAPAPVQPAPAPVQPAAATVQEAPATPVVDQPAPTPAPVQQVVERAVKQRGRASVAQDWDINFSTYADNVTKIKFSDLDSDLRNQWGVIAPDARTQDLADSFMGEQLNRNKGGKAQNVVQEAPATPVVEQPAPAPAPVVEQAAPTLKQAVKEPKAAKQPPAPTINEARETAVKEEPKPLKKAKPSPSINEAKDITSKKSQVRQKLTAIARKMNTHIYSSEQKEAINDFAEEAQQNAADPYIDIEGLKAILADADIILAYPVKPKPEKALSRAEIEEFSKTDEGDFPLARETRDKGETHTLESVTQHLNATYGAKNIADATKRGSLVVIKTGEELPKSVRQAYYAKLGFDGDVGTWYPKSTQALYHNGTVYIMAENTVVEETDGVLLHDIGVHAGMYEIFNPTYKNILAELQAVQKRIEKRAPNTPLEKLVRAAEGRIPDNTDAEAKPHELMAYFIEEGAALQQKLPIWTRMVSAIKTWLMKHGFNVDINKPTGLDAAINLARGAAQSWIESSTPGPGGKAPAPKTPLASTAKGKAETAKAKINEPATGAVRLAEHMREIERIGENKEFTKHTRALQAGNESEVYLFGEMSRWMSNFLRDKVPGASNALDFSKTVWERLAVPMNETLNKNYFGRLLKQIAQKHDALVNNAKANYSRYLEDIMPISLNGFLKDAPINKDTSAASIAMRIISDDMTGVVMHDKQLRDKFTDMVTAIATRTEKDASVDVETRFDKLQKSKEVDAIVDLFWTTALDRQERIKEGKLKATYWRENAEGIGVPAETDVHDFEYSENAMEIAKKSHKLLVIAALERAISQHQQSNLFAKKSTNEVSDKLYLKYPSDARTNMHTLVDIFSSVYEKDVDAARQFLATIHKHIDGQEKGKDTTYDATPKAQTVDEEMASDAPVASPEAKARAAEVFKLYTDNKALIDSISRDLDPTKRKVLQTRLSALLNGVASNRAESAQYMSKTVDTVSHFYIAHQRSSTNRVYSRLVDDKGEPVKIDFDKYPSFVMGFDSFREAQDFAKWYANDENAQQLRIKVVDRGGEEREAKLVLEAVRNDYEALAKAPAPYFDLFTFTTQLERSGVNLNGAQREQLVKAVANRTAKQLKALKYRAAKGADKDIWRAYGAYLNGNAYIVANNYTQVEFDDILYKPSWTALEIESMLDGAKLMEDSPEKTEMVRELTEGLALNKKNAEFSNNVQDLAKKVFAEYRAEAGREPNVFDDTMHFAATSFLIGNISTAVTQIMSLPILTISYLGAKHTPTGYGGGYGFANVAKELSRSLGSISKMKLFLNTGNATQPFDRVLEDKLKNAKLTGRDKLLWDYVLREVKEGKLQVGQVMAVTDMYWRGFAPQRRQKNKYVEMFMKPFSMSEAYIRMASWVTSFNLAFDALPAADKQRFLDAGAKAYDDPVFKRIAREADETVEHSQGIYSQWARAPWLQKGWGRALTMFMHYPLVQVQLLKAMPLAGQAMYIALLTAFAGLDGIPFKEDLENLLDAITRRFPEVFGRFGSKAFSGNVKQWYVENTNGLMEWAGEDGGELIRKGMFNAITGGDFSGKLGFHGFARGLDSGTGSDIFPLLGPIGGFLDATLTSTGNAANALMAASLGRDPTDYMMRTLKTFPVSAVRNAANGAFMAATGEARARTGETVATELDNFDAFMQALGWRPTEAVAEYGLRDRQQVFKDIRTNLVRSYNNQMAIAKANGDTDLVAQLANEARELTAIYRDADIPIVIKVDMDTVNELARNARETLARRGSKKLPEEMRQYFEEEIVEGEE